MTKEEYMQIREDLVKRKNGEDKPFMTVTTEYYVDKGELVFNSEGERQIRVVTTKERWIGSEKDPVTSTTFEYL
jgi:hypothetical protein